MTTKPIPLLLLAATLFLPLDLAAQVPRTFGTPTVSIPKETIERIINAQAAACRAAENATSEAELDALDFPLQQMIQNTEQRVLQLSADSAPALAAQRADSVAEARLKPLEDQLKPLLKERRRIDTEQAPTETQIAAARQGDNPTRLSLDQVNAEIKSLREQIGRDSTALRDFLKMHPDRGWWERQTGPANDEKLERAIRDKLAKLATLEDQQLTILRSSSGYQLDPKDYERLALEEVANEAKIRELEQRIAPLRKARDATEERLARFDVEGVKNLEQLHEENGFTEQYIRQGRDCIQKRRTQLASGAGAQPPPVIPTAVPGGLGTAYITGTWTATCSGDLPPSAARTDGGAMNFYFGDATKTPLDVRVDFLTTGKVGGIDYGAGGHILDDGTIADGRGGAPGLSHSLVWDGRLVPDMARSTPGLLVPDKWMGSGNVTVTDIYKAGGGTCTGTWTAATP